jgi:raffinose/stachyose/melibiose transport system substrate-binding protein
MNMEGTWFLEEIDSFFGEQAGNENEWGWTPLPSLRDEIPRPLFELGLGSTLSINRRSEQADAAAEYINWYYSVPERVTQRMADVPAVFNVPIAVEEEDFPANMDERVVEILATLTEATSKGNYGYTTWTFWPPKTDLFIYEEMQSVITNKMTPAEFCAGVDEIFREDLDAGEVPPLIQPASV